MPTKRRAPAKGPVVQAVEFDLKAVRAVAPDLAKSSLAASALALARELDTAANSATAKSMCARELRETLDRLRGLVPPAKEHDRLDELSQQRATRIARSAKT